MLGHRAPDRAVLVQRQRAAGAGPTDGAGTFLPLLAAAGRELSLGGAVELPRRPGRERRDQPLLDGHRARRSRVGHQAERGQVRDAHLVPVREEALQVGRHAEHRGGPVPRDRCGDGGGVERARDDDGAAGQERPHREAQGSGVVERAEHQVHVAGAEAPQVALLGHERRRLPLGQQPAVDALGRPGRATGHVHRSGPRSCAAEALRGVPQHRVELSGRLHDQVRTQSREDPLALVRREARVEGDREHPGRQQGHHQVQVGHRPGQEQGDPRSLAQLDPVHGVDPSHRPWRGRMGAC